MSQPIRDVVGWKEVSVGQSSRLFGQGEKIFIVTGKRPLVIVSNIVIIHNLITNYYDSRITCIITY